MEWVCSKESRRGWRGAMRASWSWARFWEVMVVVVGGVRRDLW
jgi:hypothetical protein